MALLIDSSTFIALERRGQTLGRLATVARMDESVALAAITAAEPLTGVHRADTRERRIVRERFVETVLASVPSLAFDVTVARVYATLWADLHAVGQIIGAHDLMIAATALAHGYQVLTDNIRDFERVPGLTIQQPAW